MMKLSLSANIMIKYNKAIIVTLTCIAFPIDNGEILLQWQGQNLNISAVDFPSMKYTIGVLNG